MRDFSHPLVRGAVAMAFVTILGGAAGCETVGRACDAGCGSFFDSIGESCAGTDSSPEPVERGGAVAEAPVPGASSAASSKEVIAVGY